MLNKALLITIISLTFVGCASVNMESVDRSNLAKEFNAPADNQSGLYIYRSGVLGSALKKDVWVDESCVGETAPNVFFYTEVPCNESLKVSTESEFSPNDLLISTECGKNYFLSQYIKFGFFVGGAGLEQVSEEKGKKEVEKLEMAKAGSCSSSYK